jgi:hypothetical protein
VRQLCQVDGITDTVCFVSSNGIANTARQIAVGRQFNRVLPLLCAYVPPPPTSTALHLASSISNNLRRPLASCWCPWVRVV